MKLIIILLGILILIMGMAILISPDDILSFFETNKESQALYIFGVLIRMSIGVLLILSANESKHPSVVGILGFFSLFAALILAGSLWYLGQEKLQEIVSTLISDYKSFAPVLGVFSIGIGGFLVYAFLGRRI